MIYDFEDKIRIALKGNDLNFNELGSTANTFYFEVVGGNAELTEAVKTLQDVGFRAERRGGNKISAYPLTHRRNFDLPRSH